MSYILLQDLVLKERHNLQNKVIPVHSEHTCAFSQPEESKLGQFAPSKGQKLNPETNEIGHWFSVYNGCVDNDHDKSWQDLLKIKSNIRLRTYRVLCILCVIFPRSEKAR